MHEPRIQIHGLTADELQQLARERLPRGAGLARALHARVLREARFAPQEHGLSRASVEAWRTHFCMQLPEVVRAIEEDGPTGTTSKAVMRLPDGLEYECVRLPMGRERHTLCVSTQIGCKMACRFCETGRMGMLRNLSADEVIAQVLVARHVLGWSHRNLVFMGMGEALDNFDALSRALRILTDPAGMRMAQERITVCTVGHVEGLRKLAALRLKRLNLSISLNAARDELRDRLMPLNRKYPLRQVQQALIDYRQRNNLAIGVNYCLMPGLNDTRDDARQVAAFCRPLGRALVNVIPYNPGGRPLTRAPEDDEVARFIEWLRDEGVPVRKRVTKGRDVMAACGQLGNVQLRRRRAEPGTADMAIPSTACRSTP